MTIEIQPTTVGGPTSAALTSLAEALSRHHVCQVDNIDIVVNAAVAPIATMDWTNSLLDVYIATNRKFIDYSPSNDHLFVFIAYLPGSYAMPDYDNVIGLHYSTTCLIYFIKAGSDLEYATLLHEFGHLLGVAANRDGPQVNPDRPKHCSDPACVMYWIVPRTLQEDREFCTICAAELKSLIQKRH